jgi:hypothetical protein
MGVLGRQLFAHRKQANSQDNLDWGGKLAKSKGIDAGADPQQSGFPYSVRRGFFPDGEGRNFPDWARSRLAGVFSSTPTEKGSPMLVLLLVIILILALGGGIFISKFLFLLLLLLLLLLLFRGRF